MLRETVLKSLAEIQVDNIHCSPLIYPAKLYIIEDFFIPLFMLHALVYKHSREVTGHAGLPGGVQENYHNMHSPSLRWLTF